MGLVFKCSPEPDNVGLYDCPVTVSLRDSVYLVSDDAVDQADATSLATMPVIGMVRLKPTATSCVVQYAGELDGFSGLIAGSTYYQDLVSGDITDTPPSSPGEVLQRLGFAKSSGTLVVQVDRDIIVIS